jgi:hypothetical protein
MLRRNPRRVVMRMGGCGLSEIVWACHLFALMLVGWVLSSGVVDETLRREF